MRWFKDCLVDVLKEAAAYATSIALVRCQPPGSADVQCVVDRVLKGAAVKGPILVRKRAWVRYDFGALGLNIEKVEFLILLDDGAREMCFGDLPILSDTCTSMVPIVEGWLPTEFRASYDGASRGRLSRDAVIRGILAVERKTK